MRRVRAAFDDEILDPPNAAAVRVENGRADEPGDREELAVSGEPPLVAFPKRAAPQHAAWDRSKCE